MAPRKEGKPRSHVGGRSPRHAERHAARGHARTFAPSWTDAVAHTVLQALQEGSHAAGEGITQHVMAMLSTEAAVRRFAGRLRLSADDRAVAVAILMVHSAKVAALQGEEEKKKAVRVFLKPLRERKASRLTANALCITPRPRRDTHWTAWLSPEPSQDRLRDINNSNRTTSGLQEWPLQWLTMLNHARCGVL